LKEAQGEWEGTVWALFQPGEEKLPGGASLVLKEKAFQERKPDLIIAQHVMPEMEAGRVGFRPGMYMASADELYITVRGKGGHGAMPHLVIDPILIASHLIVALQQTVSRWSHPAVPTVLSFGKIQGNGATNVIPSEVKIEGTFRTYNEEWRSQAHSRMKALVKGLAESMGGEAELDVMIGYPSLHNAPKETARLQEEARAYLGAEQVEYLDLRPTADDFAFYSQVAPSCFYRLGVGNKAKGITHSVHHPKFDIDEAALSVGTGLLAWLAFQSLK
jgi:amidohydrolase